MRSTPSDSAQADSLLPVAELRQLANDWLLDDQLRQHSAQTLYCRRDYLEKFFWFLENRSLTKVGSREVRAFLAYLNTGHEEPGGRWGNPQMTKPMRPVSIHAYHRVLRALFNWMVEDEAIDSNPMAKIKPPVVRNEVKQPLSQDQIEALLRAAKTSQNAKRDEAIIRVLVDKRCRAAELCNLRMQDLDLVGRSFRVVGKGNKLRTCYTCAATTNAPSRYLRRQKREPGEPVFVGRCAGGVNWPLKPSGLFQLVERLAIQAGKPPGQRGCHVLRRTFAVSLLRNGASAFATQNLLGHTDLTQTRAYASIAQADVEESHRKYSPGDRLPQF